MSLLKTFLKETKPSSLFYLRSEVLSRQERRALTGHKDLSPFSDLSRASAGITTGGWGWLTVWTLLGQLILGKKAG